MLDDTRPTLTLTSPQAGANPPSTAILVGMHDYNTGLDAESFEVVADFAIDGTKPGENLAKKFKALPDGRWELRLEKPVDRAAEGQLTVSVKDRQGNVTRDRADVLRVARGDRLLQRRPTGPHHASEDRMRQLPAAFGRASGRDRELALPALLGAGGPPPLRPPRPSADGFGRAKSCILLFMGGGPSQLATFDLKPDAPAEVRGDFRPIATDVPGIRISDHLPLLARQAHKYAVIRSVTDDFRPPRSISPTVRLPDDPEPPSCAHPARTGPGEDVLHVVSPVPSPLATGDIANVARLPAILARAATPPSSFIRACGSTGLTRWWSKPASCDRRRSSSWPQPVRAISTMLLPHGCSRMRRQAS